MSEYQKTPLHLSTEHSCMVYDSLVRALLGERCPACMGASAMGFCAGCRAELARVARPCRNCGLPLPARACPRQTSRWTLDAVIAPLQYTEPVDGYIHALKFAGRRPLGRALGTLLVETLRATPPSLFAEMIVPVPLHRRRFLERGYNQAVEIARTVAATLKIQYCVAGIRRHRATAAQTQLSARERRANLRNAFSVTRNFAGRHVAIVDDVITTGATVNALARELKLAGARSVQAWAVARAV